MIPQGVWWVVASERTTEAFRYDNLGSAMKRRAKLNADGFGAPWFIYTGPLMLHDDKPIDTLMTILAREPKPEGQGEGR